MIRLLIVDDSPLMRRLLSEIFGGEPDFEFRVARDGVEALAVLKEFRPDVVTLDVHMPKMDGLACLDRIMLEHPCPVVMLSSLTRDGADETVTALSLGAVDFVPKPAGALSLEMDAFAPVLLEVVRNAAQTHMPSARRLAERVRLRAGRAPAGKAAASEAGEFVPRGGRASKDAPALVIVGASTGGPPALDALLAPLPENFGCPVLIAQHMPSGFTAALARRLDSFCAMNVVEVDRAMPILAGRVYIGRGNADLIVSARPDGLFANCAPAAAEYTWHPSVDRLVESALKHMPPEQLIGVLMTGMGDDGARSMSLLHKGGGYTIAEAEETAVVWGMPGALVRMGGASEVAPLEAISRRLLDRVNARQPARRTSPTSRS